MLALCGCNSQAPQQPAVTPSPSNSVPAGLVEVSRLEGVKSEKADESDKFEESAKSGKSDESAKSGKSDESDKSGKSDKSDKSESVSGEVKSDNTQGSSASTKAGSDISAADGAQSDAKSDAMSDKASDMSNAAAQGVQTLETTAITARGENPWTLDAQKVEYDGDSKKVRVKAIVWSLLNKDDNTPRVTVRGQSAVVNIESQNVAFEGPVNAVGSRGEVLKVNKLVWDSKRQKILGSHGVRVVRQGTVMTGDNLVASPDLKQVEVNGHVRVVLGEMQ